MKYIREKCEEQCPVCGDIEHTSKLFDNKFHKLLSRINFFNTLSCDETINCICTKCGSLFDVFKGYSL